MNEYETLIIALNIFVIVVLLADRIRTGRKMRRMRIERDYVNSILNANSTLSGIVEARSSKVGAKVSQMQSYGMATERLKQRKPIKKTEMADLLSETDRTFGNFTIRLKRTYPQLKEKDTQSCCLRLLGFDTKHIAVLMDEVYSTESRRHRRIAEITNNAENELNRFIVCFAIPDVAGQTESEPSPSETETATHKTDTRQASDSWFGNTTFVAAVAITVFFTVCKLTGRFRYLESMFLLSALLFALNFAIQKQGRFLTAAASLIAATYTFVVYTLTKYNMVLSLALAKYIILMYTLSTTYFYLVSRLRISKVYKNTLYASLFAGMSYSILISSRTIMDLSHFYIPITITCLIGAIGYFFVARKATFRQQTVTAVVFAAMVLLTIVSMDDISFLKYTHFHPSYVRMLALGSLLFVAAYAVFVVRHMTAKRKRNN